MIMRIELGGGERPKIRPNIDIRVLPSVDIVADVSKGLPLRDCSVDEIFSEYLVEHIGHRLLFRFFREIYRVVRPGGRMVIATANLLAQAQTLFTSHFSRNHSELIFGTQDYPENSHKSGFSPQYIIDLLREIGFSQVIVTPHWLTPTDMIIEAIK